MSKLIAIELDLEKLKAMEPVIGTDGKSRLKITMVVNNTKKPKNKGGGDCDIWAEQTPEERAAKAPKTFLGNGRTFWVSAPDTMPTEDGATAPAPAAPATQTAAPAAKKGWK